MPEIKEALLKRGYVPVIIGGGVTGDIQINDTDLHSPLRAKYRELEQLLMIDQLKANPKKIPQPSRDDIMRMLSESFETVETDVVTHFKSLWVTNALDGCEDYLVSERKMLDVEKLEVFRKQLNKAESPENLKDLLKLITPPKGVQRKGEKTAVPVDEGEELFDCDGEELNHEPLLESDDSDQDDEENGDPANEGEQSQTENQQTTTAAPVLLASIVKDNPELEKDAIFIDNLVTLLFTSHTSDKFIPFMNKFKWNYIAGRRAVKKRILCSKEKVVAREEGNPSDVEDDSYLTTFLLRLLAFL